MKRRTCTECVVTENYRIELRTHIYKNITQGSNFLTAKCMYSYHVNVLLQRSEIVLRLHTLLYIWVIRMMGQNRFYFLWRFQLILFCSIPPFLSCNANTWSIIVVVIK